MIELSVHGRIRQIPQSGWDALAVREDSPFTSWTFLDVLERTGCVSRVTYVAFRCSDAS